MKVLSMELRQTPDRKAKITVVLDTPPNNLSKATSDIQQGKVYDLTLKPHKDLKTDEQRMCVWAKIEEISRAIGSSRDEVYEQLILDYAPTLYKRLMKEDVEDEARHYKKVEIKADHKDGSVTVLCYKGLSEMKTDEAAAFLDRILDECKELGLSGEVG